MQDKKWLLVLLLALLSVGANFWGFPIYILDEAKNASCAMEMMQRGDWVVPTFNGLLRTDKPPLHYFFMMASYEIFGVSPFSARLFSVVMGLLTIWVVYFFTKRMVGAGPAFFASLILVCSLYFSIQFHLAVPDPYLIFFLTASGLCFLYGHQTNQAIYFYLSYASLALAFMAKGPVAVVVNGIIFLLFLLLQGRFSWRELNRIKIVHGVVVFLVIVLPWWISIGIATDGEWIAGFLWGHNVARFISPLEGHAIIPGQTLLYFFVALLPLSIFLPGAASKAWTGRKTNMLAFFCLVGATAIVAFFTFSQTLLPTYIGPAVPWGAILLGIFIDRKVGSPSFDGRLWKFASVVVLLLTATIPFAIYWVIGKDRWISDLAYMGWWFALLPAGALAAVYFIFNAKWKGALLSYLVSWWLLGIALFYGAVPQIFARNPVSSSVALINQSGREVLAYSLFNPAYIFSFQRPLIIWYKPADILSYSAGKSVIVVTRLEYKAELEAVGFKVIYEKPFLFENATALVMINEP